MLEFCDIKFAYPNSNKTLLDSLSAKICDGELAILLGVNGAGKSTLINILSGFTKPSCGKVFLNGKNVLEFSATSLARQRAVLEQADSLNFNYTLKESVLLGRYAFNNGFLQTLDDEEIALNCIAKVGLSGMENRLYPSLSGGEKRRAFLARVLAQIYRSSDDYSGTVLFLDEPSAGLDPAHTHLVLQLARNLANKGATVFAILHDPNLALQYADKIALLKDSKFLAYARAQEVFEENILSETYSTPCKIHSLSDSSKVAIFKG